MGSLSSTVFTNTDDLPLACDIGVAPGAARARRSARVAGLGNHAASHAPRDALDPPQWCRPPQCARADAGTPARPRRATLRAAGAVAPAVPTLLSSAEADDP